LVNLYDVIFNTVIPSVVDCSFSTLPKKNIL
jgi:hypothetical protein